MILNRTVDPGTGLVTLTEAKDQANVEHADHDTLIEGYISAASKVLEERTGRALVTQTWQAKVEPVSGRTAFVFPKVPLIALSSVAYFDRDNAAQTLATGDVTVYSEEDRAWMVPNIGTNWPGMYQRPDAMTVTWTAGYGAGSAVPANIVQAAKLLIAHWYANREVAAVGASVATLPHGVEDLAGLSRLGWVGA